MMVVIAIANISDDVRENNVLMNADMFQVNLIQCRRKSYCFIGLSPNLNEKEQHF